MKNESGDNRQNLVDVCTQNNSYMGAVSQLFELAESAKTFVVDNMRTRSQSITLAKIDNLTSHILNKGSSVDFNQTNDRNLLINMTRDVMEVGDLLSNFDNQRVASPEEITELLAKIDEVMNFVAESQLDDRMKSRMLRALGMLRTSVQRSRFTGIDEIIADMDSVLGVGVRALGTAQTPEQKQDAETFLKKASEASESIGKVLEFGNKYLMPALPYVSGVVKSLTGG